MAKITKTIKLALPALFVSKKATLPENAGTIHLDHPLLMLPTIHKDIGDARYTLQGVITAPRHPPTQIRLYPQHTVIATHAANSFSGIDLSTADQFNQLLNNPKSSATAFAVHISHVEAPIS